MTWELGSLGIERSRLVNVNRVLGNVTLRLYGYDAISLAVFALYLFRCSSNAAAGVTIRALGKLDP